MDKLNIKTITKLAKFIIKFGMWNNRSCSVSQHFQGYDVTISVTKLK